MATMIVSKHKSSLDVHVHCEFYRNYANFIILRVHRYFLRKCPKFHRLAKFNGFSAIGMELPTCEGTMLQIVVSHTQYCTTWISWAHGLTFGIGLGRLCYANWMQNYVNIQNFCILRDCTDCSSQLNSAHIELCIRIQVDYVRKIIIASHRIALCCAVLWMDLIIIKNRKEDEMCVV